MSPPRLFMSYSWSSQDHELWVIDLATRLRESGIDVILDKWELKEGHDSIAFMEKMVTDPTIKKVAVISDRKYAEKADGRVSGVGTETQIISREVYEKQDQNKFVAVLPERDYEGKPFLPTYYKGRIYIDLSAPDNYAAEFERLVRWVFDKPMHVKPEIGKAPAFLQEEPAKSLGTSVSSRRCLDALKNGRPFVEGAVDEYLTTFAENLERFRITLDGSKDADEQIADSIEEFTPYKDEFVQVMLAIAQYAASDDMQKKLHRFFEQLLPYLERAENMNSHHSWAFDNFKFIVHELYLHTVAILIRYERFALVDRLLATPYYVSTSASRGREATTTFAEFRSYMESFKGRDNKLGRLSSRADLLKQRAELSGFDFKGLMQADFVLYLRATLNHDYYVRWWPETLVYATHSYGPMEVFARSRSASYYAQVSKLLGGLPADDLKAHVAKQYERDDIPRWQFERISPGVLAGIDKLASIQ
ncbi:TIR domain-containing protein [Luteimonas sp. FCS-9]|uniref:toll/interleukin-1 receptor domain-containing protein n=1 Tax=Luteimonas sp. FCS-9 TaxID=1547516 RepID=UPI00063EC21C|nr:TIR domain-containing protein [Luteimonas sp. FCS-9]KLJ00826.1 SEFIR domain-containing protein [Luteimonas sp. FCS-9]